jgi:hypothetical protein
VVVQCCDSADIEPFRGGHNGCIGTSQPQIGVFGKQLRDPSPVSLIHGLRQDTAGGEVLDKSPLWLISHSAREEVGDLGDNKLGHDERPRQRRQKLQTLFVIGVAAIGLGIQRASVD